jgi:DUF1365 family protein
MKSAIYVGHVRHRRYAPRPHAFEHILFMMYLDLAELPMIFNGRWLWSTSRWTLARFRRGDYLGDPAVPLDQAVRDCVETQTGYRPRGPIRLLTHLRYFGISFNPVSFYYCFDESDRRVETIVVEVTNTPWHERHAYVLTDSMNEASGGKKHYRLGKDFHVSPFMEMDLNYDWRFIEPGAVVAAHMENFKNEDKIFDATLTLKRREISGTSLAQMLAFYPLMTTKVVAAIYWQALRLWFKRVPLYTHPTKSGNNAFRGET